jgi:hypothetical protein
MVCITILAHTITYTQLSLPALSLSLSLPAFSLSLSLYPLLRLLRYGVTHMIGNVILTDFGLAHRVKKNKVVRSFSGTDLYLGTQSQRISADLTIN